MKGFALRLVLKQRHKRTRKWPITIFREEATSVELEFELIVFVEGGKPGYPNKTPRSKAITINRFSCNWFRLIRLTFLNRTLLQPFRLKRGWNAVTPGANPNSSYNHVTNTQMRCFFNRSNLVWGRLVIHPSSETQGLLAGTMRYFWATVYFKSWRAPGNLFLPNQFQKWSNSVPLIGQKNIFLPN